MVLNGWGIIMDEINESLQRTMELALLKDRINNMHKEYDELWEQAFAIQCQMERPLHRFTAWTLKQYDAFLVF